MNRIEAYRRGDHVILIIRKNASTYLEKNIKLWGGWDFCETSDINWAKDHVTGVMQHPLRRWSKGLTQDLWDSPRLQAWATEDPREFFNLFADYLGNHCSPVTFLLGDRANLVQWMLADHPEITLDRQLCLWLRQQGLDHRPMAQKIHQSDPKKAELHRTVERQLKRLLQEYPKKTNTGAVLKNHNIKKNSQLSNYQLLLAEDLILYKRLKNSMNPQADGWDQLYTSPTIQNETTHSRRASAK